MLKKLQKFWALRHKEIPPRKRKVDCMNNETHNEYIALVGTPYIHSLFSHDLKEGRTTSWETSQDPMRPLVLRQNLKDADTNNTLLRECVSKCVFHTTYGTK